MNVSEDYFADVLMFFDGKPLELSLYQALFEQLEKLFPGGSVRVQKSQISFYGRHLYGAASLPVRRRKGWPEHCLVVTLGLNRRLESPRVAVAVEPYPGRWTHHFLLTETDHIDGELLGWFQEAWDFAESKR